jgi:isopentenyl diphosphate isomerase/L-lactate dehydrogenase-like FMN-dependent dehydrogenase
VLRDVAERDLAVELFGRDVAAPVVLAPVGGQARYDDEGEVATARAARELGVPLAMSTVASRSIEAVAEASGDAPRYFQLYWPRDWDVAESVVTRAAAAGFDALILTVDSQLPKWRRRVLGHLATEGDDWPRGVYESDPVVRERAEAGGRDVAAYVSEPDTLRKDASLTWDDLDALRSWTDLPVVLKGVLAVEDARRAAEWGADGVVVSNHGGRQVDGEVGALDQLPAVVEAVGDDLTVLVDSGVRTGTDVLKALALGADAVLFGRPYVFGLAVAGQRGVYETTLNCLAELESAMGLTGHPTVGAVGPDAVVEGPAAPTATQPDGV